MQQARIDMTVRADERQIGDTRIQFAGNSPLRGLGVKVAVGREMEL
jgi:hypothetical protein